MQSDYELFAQVVEAGSLSAAGRRLGMSPAMVSKRIARLEERLGARLAHRTTRRLTLTSAGKAFHEDVLGILDAVRLAEGRVSGRERLESGPLRLSAPTSFGRLYVAPYLKGFLDAYPQIEVQLDLSDAYVDLIGERVDLAIRIAPAVGGGLVGHHLAVSRRVLCAAPSYLSLERPPADIEALRSHHLLAAEGQMPWRLDGPEGAITVEGRSRVLTNSSEVVRELTLAGAGIALRSLWDVGRDIAQGRLTQILSAYEGSSSAGIYAVHPAAGRPPATVSAFVAYLRDLYATPAPWEA